jgi:uncharacterized membrane protein YeiH
VLLTVLDLLGIAVFAVSGSLAAVQARMDLFGVITLSVLTALGGGVVRDVLLGITPPTPIVRLDYLLTPVAVALAVFALHPVFHRLHRGVLVADAFGLGLFATAGATIALDTGAPPLTAIITGLITAVGGGVLRDVLADTVPTVLRGQLYAVPALLAALLVVSGHQLGLPPGPTTAVAAGVGTALRLAAMARRWEAPLPRRR